MLDQDIINDFIDKPPGADDGRQCSEDPRFLSLPMNEPGGYRLVDEEECWIVVIALGAGGFGSL